MSTPIVDYCIHPRNITLGLRKVAAAAELTRAMAPDSVCAMAVSPTSARDSLSSIFCDDEASRQAPRSRSQASHARVPINSTRLTRSWSTSSSTSTCSLDSPLKKAENALVEFENKSKFFEQVLFCSFCNKQGPNFPKCGKCDKAWCSRDCRLKGSMQHACTQQRLKGLKPVLYRIN
jgi:hypothetical protein